MVEWLKMRYSRLKSKKLKLNCNKNSKLVVFIFLFSCIVLVVHSEQFITSPYSDYIRLSELAGEADLINNNYHTYNSFKDDMKVVSNSGIWKSKYLDGFNSEKDLFDLEPVNAFLSYNSEYPHGFNDGVLWQGAGLNGLAQLGIAASYKWFSIDLYPSISFSENKSYDTMEADPSFSSEYAYFTPNIDLPQRFGDSVYTQFSWGQSEIRFEYDFLQIGFGWQNVWLGPSTQNSILYGNCADGFPNLDFVFRKNFEHIGLLDFRSVWGKLTESDYFNDVPTDDHNLFSGLFITYAPSFVPGFTLGLNRIKLSAWENISFDDIFSIFNPKSDASYGRDEADQRASITGEWKFRNAGFRGYFEWARNDYSPTLRDNMLLEPSHSQAFTIGFEQVLFANNEHFVAVNGEITQLIHTRDYEIGLGMSQTGFYTHGIIQQGHTNAGQILGAGIGPGAESQYLGIHYIYKRGSGLLFSGG